MKPSLFLILFIFITSLAFAQDADLEHFYYLGTVGEDAVQLELTLNGTEAIGSYYYNIIGAPIELRGKQTGDLTETGQPYTLEELDENGAAVATFEGELSSSSLEFGNSFTGTWTGNNGVTLTFELERVAEFAELSLKQNRIESSSSYPVFSGDLAVFNAAIDQTKQLESTLQFFEEGQVSQTKDELYNGWTLIVNHEIKYASEGFVSILVPIYTYTGGAHGNTGFDALNFLREEDSVRRLELRDVFIENADLKPVLETVTGELEARQASFSLKALLFTLRLTQWLLTQKVVLKLQCRLGDSRVFYNLRFLQNF
jgi:Deacetylase PdaC